MRLATFNILHARSLADGQVDLDRFAAAVRDLDADVLALQEVDRDQPRSHGADLTVLAAEAMGAPEHRFAAVLHGEPGPLDGRDRRPPARDGVLRHRAPEPLPGARVAGAQPAGAAPPGPRAVARAAAGRRSSATSRAPRSPRWSRGRRAT